MAEIEYDEDKLRELVLYVAAQTRGDETFGATKLNKVLYFADFLYYASKGRPITGAAYQKLRFGPAPRRLMPIRQHLLATGAASIDRSQYLGRFRVNRLVPERGPNLSLFTEDELAFVDRIIDEVGCRTAVDASELSHREVGWALAEEGEDIPYYTVWLSYEPPTEDDRQRAKELAEKLIPA